MIVLWIKIFSSLQYIQSEPHGRSIPGSSPRFPETLVSKKQLVRRTAIPGYLVQTTLSTSNTRACSHTRSQTDTDTHAASLQGHRTPLPRQWEWVRSRPRCSVRGSSANSVQSARTNGDQDVLHVNAPSRSRECTTDHRVHRNSLKPPVGGFLFTGLFLFTTENSSSVHRILLTYGISQNFLENAKFA